MRRVARRGLAAAFAVLGLLAVAGVAGANARHARATPRGFGVLVPAHKGQVLPRHGGTTSSLNWSGYAVTPAKHNVTAVASTFSVPAAGLVPPGFAATWTGIGGYSSSDLIQAGTAEQSTPSNPLVGAQYYAWYELLPASETQLTGCRGDANCTVTPGDKVTVKIARVAKNRWRIAMTDAGHWSWRKTVTYNSSKSSAEWILEAPTLGAQTPLANVGTAYFGPTSSYTAGRKTRTIAHGSPTRIDLGTGVVNEATPSNLSRTGRSFNDCAYQQGCPSP